MITIRHTHEDGTLVYGTSKGDGVYELIGPRTAARFRYFPSIRMIGIPQSRDHLADRWRIGQAEKALRAAGFEVTVEIDDTPRDVAEVKADRAERLDARYERLTAKAERSASEANARFKRADQISERFAFGQPILVGHHSERGARADQKRIDQDMRAGVEAAREAERASAAASVVGSAEAHRELPPVIIRRIAKHEADLRKVDHDINGTRPANDRRGAYGYDRKPASGAWLEQLQARRTYIEHQLAADREALAAHEANGYVRFSREMVHPGDIITSTHWWDRPEKVVRANAKTVSVETGYTWTRKVPYETIKSVHCPHEDATTTQVAPKRTPKRKPAAAPVERPAERPEILRVDAGTECFTSPPAVVARIIEAAEVEPGMTVLEPSAGTGAIARPVAALGATVDCIELNWKLAGQLERSAGLPWEQSVGMLKVQCGDFLEVDPVALREAEAAGTWIGKAPAYDRVLMNPPFARQADIRHVTHALGFVKPGGRVVAVMSAGVEFRQDKATEQFRKMVADRGGWIERLPDDAFEASGTSVRTVLAVIPAGEGEEST